MSQNVIGQYLCTEFFKQHLAPDAELVSSTDLTDGKGYTSKVYKVVVNTISGDSQTAKRLILKLDYGGNEIATKTAHAQNMWQREINFYKHVPSGFTDITPIFYAGSGKAEAIQWLIIEDLSTMHSGHSFQGLQHEQAKAAAAVLGKIHGRLQGNQGLSELLPQDGLWFLDQEWLDQGMKEEFPILFNEFCDLFSSKTSSQVLKTIGELPEVNVMVQQRLTDKKTKRTIIHGDFRADNIMYSDEQGDKPISILDWAGASLSIPTIDLSYLFISSISVYNIQNYAEEIYNEWLQNVVSLKLYTSEEANKEFQFSKLMSINIAIRWYRWLKNSTDKQLCLLLYEGILRNLALLSLK